MDSAQIDSGSGEVEFQPFKFVPVFGSGQTMAAFSGTTLVMPNMSAGMSPMIASDLFISNEGQAPVGYLKSEYISPIVQNDTVRIEGTPQGQIQMPVVFYMSANNKYTFLVMRTGVTSGNMKRFGAALCHFIAEAGFKQIFLLSSTSSPVRRGRESNREIPEIYGYVNNVLYKTHIEGDSKKSYYDEF